MHAAGQGNSTIWVLKAGQFEKVRLGSWEIFKAYQYAVRHNLRMWIKAVPCAKRTEFAVYDVEAVVAAKGIVEPVRQLPTFGAAVIYAAVQGGR